MTYIPILPVQGIPDELIIAINTRFRQITGDTGGSAAGADPGLICTHANRPSINITPLGTYCSETDRGVTYQLRSVSSSRAWVYASGVMRAAFASAPTDLGANDAGFLWSVSDYAHLLRWTGTGWEFVDEMGGYVAWRVVAPDGNGWQLCNGSATHYLHISAGVASEVAHTTLNLSGSPAYLKYGAAYAGSITAAVLTTSGPTGNQTVTAGGATAASTAHTHTLTADPVANAVGLPYFRR